MTWEVLNEPGYGKLLVMHRNLYNAIIWYTPFYYKTLRPTMDI